MTVVDEAVTVVDDPAVQRRGKGLSVGQRSTAGCAAARSPSVMVMREGERDKREAAEWRESTFARPTVC